MKKVVIVTDAAIGIGYATSKIFSERGYTVMAMDIINPSKSEMDFIKCDVSDENDVANAVNYTVK
jgi:NAD(P)-dependent dehydrogenase (short-subunit alcohol dehydrogenase family)